MQAASLSGQFIFLYFFLLREEAGCDWTLGRCNAAGDGLVPRLSKSHHMHALDNTATTRMGTGRGEEQQGQRLLTGSLRPKKADGTKIQQGSSQSSMSLAFAARVGPDPNRSGLLDTNAWRAVRQVVQCRRRPHSRDASCRSGPERCQG